jgi:outer membrane protein assembly factor BamA
VSRINYNPTVALLLMLIVSGAVTPWVSMAGGGESSSPAAAGYPGGMELSRDKLQRELAELSADGLEGDPLLAATRLAIIDAGWLADTLYLQGDLLQSAGLRTRPLRIAQLRSKDLTSPWQVGDLISNPGRLKKVGERWLQEMDLAGYPFAQIWLQPLGEDLADTLELRVVMVPGPGGGLGEIRVTGLSRLEEPFIRSYLDFENDLPLSLTGARAGRDQLLGTGWFLSVSEPRLGWDVVTGKVGVLYEVKERPRPNRVIAAVGGGSGATVGTLELDFFSPFGGGRRWRLQGNWQGGEQERLNVDLSEPRLMGWPLAADLLLARARQDSTWLRQSVQLDLRLLLGGGLTGVAGVGYERSLFEQSESQMSRRRHRFGIRWRSLGPGLPGASRINIIGDLLIKSSSLPGEKREEKQYEGKGDWLWTRQLSDLWRWRWRGGGAILLPVGDGFNAAELFPLGGALTLRGYDEEHFRGDRIAWSGMALAWGQLLELSLFLDYGWGRWLRQGSPQVDFEGWGYGIGLNAPTPGGVFTLSLAVGEEKSFGAVRVHVAFDTGF